MSATSSHSVTHPGPQTNLYNVIRPAILAEQYVSEGAASGLAHE